MSAPDQVPAEGFVPVDSARDRAGDAGPQSQDERDEILGFAADIDTGDTTG
jgi:hypothetical protein